MKTARKIILILFILNIAFIWGNSLLPSDWSNALSNPIAGDIGQRVEDHAAAQKTPPAQQTPAAPTETAPDVQKDVTESVPSDSTAPTETAPPQKLEHPECVEVFGKEIAYWIRKAAHLTEFLLLGVLTALLIFFGSIFSFDLVAYSALIGIMTALIDETIQIFNGRSPGVADIWLDFGGFTVGFAVTFLIKYFRAKRKKLHK